MTFLSKYGYWIATLLMLGALALLFVSAPEREPGPNDAPPPVLVKTTTTAPDPSSFTRAAELGETFVFAGPDVLAAEGAVSAPPKVIGIGNVGRRRFVYVATGDGPPKRLAIGEEAGGWRLMSMGGNYAEFAHSGVTKRVGLYRTDKGVSARLADAVP